MSTEDNVSPVPPPFMFTCDSCWQLLVLLAKRVREDAGCFTEQVNLARHIAAAHPDEVPKPHGRDCPLCPKYAELPDDAGTWARQAPSLAGSRAIARLRAIAR
ncbi:hypothetical protein [Streptomyces murinus]|uniref:hypothetical protein n=1 Tax=Streptomyces murinus TaxID=33900 RepID=UPI002115C78E|nr:hypothetical protein [Streptomyces murinus]